MRKQVNSLLNLRTEADRIFAAPPVDFTAVFVDEQVELPRRIGDYRLVKEVGRGGMGAVYLAERADGEFEKKVAVKIMNASFQTFARTKRFQDERQILASLEHPNIVSLLDGGATADGLPYLVMEYVEGMPLDKFQANNLLPISELLQIFLKICNAVQYAHQNLIVHRDLKPSNILVKSDKNPKLLDFGIAKLLKPDLSLQDLTQTAPTSVLSLRDMPAPSKFAANE